MLESAAAQDVTEYGIRIEVVVVDDGSTPDAAAICRRHCDRLGERFRYLADVQRERGRGPAASRNRGIEAGTGTFIAFCDDDDVFTATDHLSAAVRGLSENDLDLWFTEMRGIREGEVALPMRFPKCSWLTAGPLAEPFRGGDVPVHLVSRGGFMRLMARHFPHLNTVVVRRSLVQQVGGFLDDLIIAQDMNFLLRVGDACDECLYRDESTADFNLAPPNSHFTSYKPLDRNLQIAFSADRAAVRLRTAEGRSAAAAIASWSFRQAAKRLAAGGNVPLARTFRRRAFATRPSAGTFRALCFGESPAAQDYSSQKP